MDDCAVGIELSGSMAGVISKFLDEVFVALAQFVLGEPVDGQTHVRGRLQGMEGDDVMVAVGKDQVRRIPASRIARARLEVEF